jgi:SAM-dependent methyltransferase
MKLGRRRVQPVHPDEVEPVNSSPAGPPSNPGHCAICMASTTFVAHGLWLRDEYLCARCHTVPRQRALVEVLSMVQPQWRTLAVHESSPSMWFFREQCADYSYSYYFDDVTPGDTKDGVRCEDLENLTFHDESFDVFITQDVLEHVFHPDRALSEISRVLKRGGIHVFTAPKHKFVLTSFARAELRDGEIHHLHEPQYHGNPISDDGSLVTWDYGGDFDDLLQQWSGYLTSTYVIRDRNRGIEGEYLEVFVTTKDDANRAPDPR